MLNAYFIFNVSSFFLFTFFIAAGTITCQIDSPDRDECIKEAIQDMLPKLVVSWIRIYGDLFRIMKNKKKQKFAYESTD